MEVLQALSFACSLVPVGAGTFAFFAFRARDRKLRDAAQDAHEQHKQRTAELAEQIGSLREALVEAGLLQRAALPPPPSPSASKHASNPEAPPKETRQQPTTPPPEQASPIIVEEPADRPTHVETREPGELVGVEVPRSSEERSIPLERQAEYTAEELAGADAYAAEKSITRERALWELFQTGVAKLRAARESGEHLTERRSTPTPASTPATGGHCLGPHCFDGSLSCMCTCPRCSDARSPLG
jgi:hypothetical protein